MSKRRKARECALQALYVLDVNEWESAEPTLSLLESVHRGMPLPPSYSDYAVDLVDGVRRGHVDLDETIGRAAEQWALSRMAVVDRNVLRLGAYELSAHPEIPTGVIINEAVELAKRFGDADSSRFINGVLDRIARETRGAVEPAGEGGGPK